MQFALLKSLAVATALAAASASAAPDLIVHNAKLATFDGSTASAFAVEDGVFSAVTNNAAPLLAQADNDTRVINAGGRRVIPGINDSHLHVVRGGRFFDLETRWEGVSSLAEGLRLISEKAEAVGPGEQPDYLNAVLALATELTALDLLGELQAIERSHGRIREQRWAARTLDLDILLYGQQKIDTPKLCIPHPRMAQRNFVLYPLLEIGGAKLLLPDGRELGTLLANCPRGDLAISQLRASGE